MSSPTKPLAIAGLFALMLAAPDLASAATIGSFQKTCWARNWRTGMIQPVPEIDVRGRPMDNVMAFTRAMPDGSWQIEWNVDRIRNFGLTNDVIVFLYYHECAHAQYASPDEGVADCGGLVAMRRDGYLSPETYQRIVAIYAASGRPFPSGPC